SVSSGALSHNHFAGICDKSSSVISYVSGSNKFVDSSQPPTAYISASKWPERLIASAYLIAEDNFWACVSDSPPSSIFCSPVDCSNFFGAPCFLKISANEASTASGFSLNNSYCSSTYPMFGP